MQILIGIQIDPNKGELATEFKGVEIDDVELVVGTTTIDLSMYVVLNH